MNALRTFTDIPVIAASQPFKKFRLVERHDKPLLNLYGIRFGGQQVALGTFNCLEIDALIDALIDHRAQLNFRG